MNFTSEAKVGLVTIIAGLLLAGMIVMIGGLQYGQRGYPVQVVFSQVAGLKPGNVVRYAGVDIGKVDSMAIAPTGIIVKTLIDSETSIPTGAKFSIGSDGLMGEKFIEVTPPRVAGASLKPNALVQGEAPAGLDEFLATAETVMKKIDVLVTSLNDVLGNETVKGSLRDSAVNLEQITANLAALSNSMARAMGDSEQDLVQVVRNLQQLTTSLNIAAEHAAQMMSDLDNDGRTAADLRQTIANIRQTSARVEKMADSLESVVTDPTTSRDLTATISNARQVSEKANRLLTSVEQLEVSGTLELLAGSGHSNYQTNADLMLKTSSRNFLRLGVKDIGEHERLNMQLGQNIGSWSARVGVFDNKAGVGIDKRLGSKMSVFVDVFEPNDVKLRYGGQYLLAPNLYLVGHSEEREHAGRQQFWGLKQGF